MDQPNTSVSPASSPNDKQDDDSLRQDQPQQETSQEVSVALNQNDTTPTVADNTYASSVPAATTEDAYGDVPAAGQPNAPSLAPEDQSTQPDFTASPNTAAQSFSPTPAASVSPDAPQALPNQPQDFNGQPIVQPPTEVGVPGTGMPGQVGASDAPQFDPNAAAQPTTPAPAHADMKSALILGAVAVVLIGLIAFFVFM